MSLLLDDSSFQVLGTEYSGQGVLHSEATLSSTGLLRLVLQENVVGCHQEDTGAYSWTLSPGGTILTILPGSDTCAARAAAVTGTWFREVCKNTDDGCFGDLEASTYPSQYIDLRLDPGSSWGPNFGALTYTVPTGWSNSSDWPVTFSLTPTPDYALETAAGPPLDTFHGIEVFARPAATTQDATCANHEETSVKRGVTSLIEWVRSRPSLVTTAPTPITIGGFSGQWIDIKLAPEWTGTCPDPSRPAATLRPTAVYLSEGGNDAQGWNLSVQGVEQQRLILLDLGDGDVVAIAIDSTHPDRYQELVTEAMPIVASFRFK